MSMKTNFLGTASVAALLFSAGSTLAQDWSPTATNTGAVIVGGTLVDNQGNTINSLGSLIGDGSSASISGAGASSSVSATTITPANPVGTVLGFNGGDFPAITNTATNNTSGSVSNANNTIAFDGGSQLSGSAAGAGISSTGASSSTSWTGIGTAGLVVGNVTSVTQSSTNMVGTTGDATRVTVSDAIISGAPDLTGNATSLSVSVTGAVASVGVRAIESDNFGMAAGAAVGPITQTATQNRAGTERTVEVSGTSVTSGIVDGVASSVSVSTTGATTSVSSTVVDSTGFGGLAIGAVGQTSDNFGRVVADQNTVQTGVVSGDVASVSISATGSAAGVSESLIGSISTAGSQFGTVDQNVRSIDGTGSLNANSGRVTTGEISGDAASARVSATNATASVSTLGADSTLGGATVFGAIDQTVSATKGLFMNSPNLTTGALSGDAASASYSATGAAASVGATIVGSSGVGSRFGTIDQDVTSNNMVRIQNGTTEVNGNVSGSAASVSASATGASGSVSATSVNSTRSAGAEFGAIESTVSRNPTVPGNEVSLTQRHQINVDGALSGNATSASLTATGASASVSDTIISGQAELNNTANTLVASIDLSASASGIVLAGQTTETNPRLSVTTGDLSGAGAAARIGSLGASASVSSVAVDGSGRSLRVAGATDLSATSTATVSTNQAAVTTGIVSGNGSSASISATGAATSVSATKVDVTTSGSRALFGDITQLGGNSGPVSLTESAITATGLTGASSGVSASAVGYSASVSVLNLGSTGATVARQYGLNSSGVTQGTVAEPITNSGTVGVSNVTVSSGAISGPAASASIGARGVSGSISLASIATTGAGINPAGGGASSNFGTISQVIRNDAAGTVSISGGSINAGGIGGAGAAASISAVGASGSVGVNSIVADSLAQAVLAAPITQSVANAAPVSVQASNIAVGGSITGNGASAGISAVGSSASVSFTTVNAGAIN
jgi:hypothetical protein